MNELPIFQVDAFASAPFKGNPAAVVLLKQSLPDRVLQAVAAENNLSETAFVEKQGDHFLIRWFTPTTEVELCGHATLAAAFVLFARNEADGDRIRFESASGQLQVIQSAEGWFTLDFPALPPQQIEVRREFGEALGLEPREAWLARDLLLVYPDEDAILQLQPDFARITQLDLFAMVPTAPGREVDFVSRFFAPREGVPEDPVTGSAHCSLTPFWANRLARTTLRARQLSARGGELHLEVAGDRVLISGQAVEYLKGRIFVPDEFGPSIGKV